MNTPPASQAVLAACIYDDNTFISEAHSSRENEANSTCRPDFPPQEARGYDFQPLDIEYRKFKVSQLPQTPVELFQHFVSLSLVEEWVQNTNSWVASLQEAGVVDSWNHDLQPTSRIQFWEPITSREVYPFLGILIHMALHIETNINDYWKAPQPGQLRPLHPFIQFISYNRFQLIYRHLRPFKHTEHQACESFPLGFQYVTEWSEHIQLAGLQLFCLGSHLAVDECMIPYTGRSKEITCMPNKAIPVGLKAWLVAQQGFFLRWIWHQPGSRYGPVGVERSRKKAKSGSLKGKEPAETQESLPEESVVLNATQSVVVALLNLLPKETYHVFVDNLFSSPSLFKSLRQHGHGTTGTARSNCGIFKELVAFKILDKSGKSGFKFNEVRVVPTPDNLVNQIAWKDNALVLFLSTVFTSNKRSKTQRKKPSIKTIQARPIQQYFGGEKLRSYHGYDHSLRRGPWQALGWTFLLDVVLVNSFILQQHGQPNWQKKKIQNEWRQCLYNALFQQRPQIRQQREEISLLGLSRSSTRANAVTKREKEAAFAVIEQQYQGQADEDGL